MKKSTKKLNKEEYEELCKLLISDSEDDFLLGKNIAKEVGLRFGMARLVSLDSLSNHKWDFRSTATGSKEFSRHIGYEFLNKRK